MKRTVPLTDAGFTPPPTPASWRRVAEDPAGIAWRRVDGLSIIVSVEETPDGVRWVHVSCAFPSELPRWKDLQQVKDVLLGPDAQAVQVLAPRAEYVNFHPYCLNLYARLDGARVVPDFRGPEGLI